MVVEDSGSVSELHCLLSADQLTIVGSSTSCEAPMRHLCVRFWHLLQRKHLTCLRAKKLAPWTHLSHSLHRYASSAWQYKKALDLQSSHFTSPEPLVALLESEKPPSFRQELDAFLPCCNPLHIFRTTQSQNSEWNGWEGLEKI